MELAGTPGEARAISYFTGPDGFGFDNSELALEPDHVVPTAMAFRSVGSDDLGDDFALLIQSKQRVKRKNGTIRVKVKWKVTNQLDVEIDEAFVFFTGLGGPDEFPDYDDVPIDLRLKRKQQRVVHYEDSGREFWFLGFELDDLKPGKRKKFKFRYDIERSELVDSTLPALGVASTIRPIPEPGTFAMLALGLGGLAWTRRSR